MCVIVHLPKHVALSQKILKNCYENNPDGFGIMAVIDGKIQIAKSMGDFNAFLAEYKQFPQNVQRAIHFRWATHGDVVEKNCHPFSVTDDIYMMHNGVLDTVNVDETFSDTWNFATHDLGRPEIIETWGKDAVTRNDFKEMLEKITVGSKLLFMDTQNRIMKTFAKDWHSERGCFFSNKHSMNEKYKAYTGKYGSYKSWYDGEEFEKYTEVTGKTSEATPAYASDLLPYGRTLDGGEGQDWLGRQPDDPGVDSEVTISGLYDMSQEDVADWVQDNPWAATDLILELIGRERTTPLFDKTGS